MLYNRTLRNLSCINTHFAPKQNNKDNLATWYDNTGNVKGKLTIVRYRANKEIGFRKLKTPKLTIPDKSRNAESFKYILKSHLNTNNIINNTTFNLKNIRKNIISDDIINDTLNNINNSLTNNQQSHYNDWNNISNAITNSLISIYPKTKQNNKPIKDPRNRK